MAPSFFVWTKAGRGRNGEGKSQNPQPAPTRSGQVPPKDVARDCDQRPRGESVAGCEELMAERCMTKAA